MTSEIISDSQADLHSLSNHQLMMEIQKLSPYLVWQVKKMLTHRMDLYNELVARTIFLEDGIEMSGRLYCLEHGITSRPMCEVCGENPTSWNRKTRSFARYCCAQCRENNLETQKRREETFMRLYNAKTSLCNDAVRQKGYKTNERIYGDRFPQRTQRCKDKARQTNLKRRGVEYPMQSKEVFAKSQQTHLLRIGVDNPMKCEIIQKKAQETCFQRYGYRCRS